MERLGVCLSGGGAKGGAHIGVLKALEEENIKVEYISGTSSGSIVASLYAAGYTPLQILSIFKSYGKYITSYDKMTPFKIIGMLFTGNFRLKGFVNGNKLEQVVHSFLKQKEVYNISDVKMPLAIPAVDIENGEIVYFLSKQMQPIRSFDDSPEMINDASLAEVVRASSSFPFVFAPKTLNGKQLIDGGVRINSPVNILKKMGATKVLAINFEETKKFDCSNMNVINVTMQTFDIMGHQMNYEELNDANVLLNINLKDVSLLEYEKINFAANEGYKITKQNIEKIKQMLK